MHTLFRKIHTLFFKVDLFWAYRYTRKYAGNAIGLRWHRLRKINNLPITVDGATFRLYFETPYHYGVVRSAQKHPESDPILISWKNTEARLYYDIGAFTGIYGILAAVSHPESEVVIFEPDPVNAKHIRKSIALNGLNNCSLIEAAVSDTDGTLRFSSSGRTDGSISTEGYEVKAISLASLAEADLIKLDVEGAEMRVIAGMNYRSRIILEIHPSKLPSFGDSEEMLWQLIEEKGFRNWFIDYQIGTGGEQKHYLLF